MKKTNLLVASLFAGLLLVSCGSKKEAGDEKKTDSTSATESSNEEGTETGDFTSEAGKFSIKFKETPKEQNQDVATLVGNVKMYMFMHEESANKADMVAYCDYPEDMMKDQDPVALLHGAKNGVVSKFNATITDEKVGKFQGYDALDFIANGPQIHTAYKLVLANNRLYQIGILQNGSAVSSSDVDSFIGSFKINEESKTEDGKAAVE